MTEPPPEVLADAEPTEVEAVAPRLPLGLRGLLDESPRPVVEAPPPRPAWPTEPAPPPRPAFSPPPPEPRPSRGEPTAESTTPSAPAWLAEQTRAITARYRRELPQ